MPAVIAGAVVLLSVAILVVLGRGGRFLGENRLFAGLDSRGTTSEL